MSSSETEKAPLHPIERTLISALARSGINPIKIDEIASQSSLSLDQVRRGLEWLRSKKLVEIEEKEERFFSLDIEGKKALTEGLPERKIVRLLQGSGGSALLSELASKIEGFSAGLGRAKQNGWVKVEGERVLLLSNFESEEPEEALIRRIGESGKLSESELSKNEITALQNLQRRPEFITEVRNKQTMVRLKEGVLTTISTTFPEEEAIGQITPEVLTTGKWKRFPLRELDVTSPVPRIFPGRRHPLRILMGEVRNIFVSMGFEEIDGSYVQSSFWNFDALFIPQRHPARELQDTFYLKEIQANLDKFASEVLAVKATHENGGSTGSIGWNYNWSEDEARRVVLRTHTTAVTIRYLAEKKPSEARVFTVSKVFRNEKPTYKNNPEFHQVDGVMVSKKLNLRTLMSVITKFYSRLGFEKVKFWPTYFPYTEPSMQTVVYHEKSKRWMELGGMGVFRPEVTAPFGIKNPVLAWGLGLDRLVMLRYNLEDIRQLFGPNLGWIRTISLS
jgi:phenylalanyl-tRNA synthetase alpha chain